MERAGERAAFPVGWYGKVPSAGDFVARRLPGPFREAWDRWLQGVLQVASRRLGADWRDQFLSMPFWRFVLAPGIAGADAYAGVLAPSADSLGRCFPFTFASALPARSLSPVDALFAAQSWFEELERIALRALAPRADMEGIARELAAQPFPGVWLDRPSPGTRVADLTPRMELAPRAGPAPRAAWFAEASDIFGRMLLVGDALPPGEAFCAMLDGDWSAHGWLRGERQPVS
jgi:type VI secretion system protein ImpM